MPFKSYLSTTLLIWFSVLLVGLAACSQAAEPTPQPTTVPDLTPEAAAVENGGEAAGAAAEAAAADESAETAAETEPPAETEADSEEAAAPAEEPEAPAGEASGILLPRPRGLEYGYADLAGEWVLEPQFEDALEFSEGLAAVRIEGQYGYIDDSGELVIEPQFGAAQSFSEGLAAVRQEQQWGYIDSGGTMVIPPQFDFANAFSEGLADIAIDNQVGFIDPTGEVVIEPQAFDFVQPFSEGLAVFGDDGLSGYLDPTGAVAIEPQFDFADNFSEGLAAVELEERTGFIDPSGEVIIEAQFDFARSFSEGLAAVVQEGQVGYIDKTGQMVIDPQFTVGFDFSEGLAAVLIDDLWGYIDPTGEMVIEPQFALAADFEDGLANVAFDERQAVYIDPSGEVVFEVRPVERVTIETFIDLNPDQINFDYDPSLAANVAPEIVPGETTLSPDVPYFALVPEHIVFTLTGSEVLAQADYEQGSIAGVEPKLLIYPAADFAEISPFAAEQIEALQELLAEQPETINFEIPTLPLVNAAQVFHSQLEYLEFEGGSGLRFITQYAQEPRPVTNAEIFYNFQGITEDGQYYIAFFYPVSTALLPNTVADSEAFADYESFVQNLDSYMPETIQRLDALSAENFVPDLTLLDGVAQSIVIEASEGSNSAPAEDAAEAQAASGDAPVGQWLVADYTFGGVSAWGEAESEALLNQAATIEADSIAFNGGDCDGLTFTSETVEAADYFNSGFRILPGSIGISQEQIEIITTPCDLPGFGEFMRLENGQLALNIEGVFFFLDPS